MKNFFLLVFLLITIKVAGQNHFVGAYGGRSTSRPDIQFFAPDQNYNRVGIGLGFTYDYMVKKWFSISSGVSYSQRGYYIFLRYGSQIQPGRDFSDEAYPTHFHYDYLSIPIKANFNFGRKFYGFGNVGILPSMLIKAEGISPDYDQNGNYIGDRSANIAGAVPKFDFSAVLESGFGYKFKEKTWLYFSLLYQRSFTDLYYPGSKLHGTTVCIGIKYALKGK